MPPLLVLNEPENSLHPELLAPLARLIGATVLASQSVLTSRTVLPGQNVLPDHAGTHHLALASLISSPGGCNRAGQESDVVAVN